MTLLEIVDAETSCQVFNCSRGPQAFQHTSVSRGISFSVAASFFSVAGFPPEGPANQGYSSFDRQKPKEKPMAEMNSSLACHSLSCAREAPIQLNHLRRATFSPFLRTTLLSTAWLRTCSLCSGVPTASSWKSKQRDS